MNTAYCIACERETHMEVGELVGHEVHVPIYGDMAEIIGIDIDFCEYPDGYAFVAPPEVEPDWVEHVVEQGGNELEIDLDAWVHHETFELMREVAEV